jgi:transcription antitermination factor NusG
VDFLVLKAVQNDVKYRWDSIGGSFGVAAIELVQARQATSQNTVEDAPQWFAIETRHRFEKKVAAQLGHQGFTVFLPLLTEHHAWSDRQQVITIPLFPGYAFVHIGQSQDSWHTVLRTAGLIRFVSFGGNVIAVPPKQIEDLQLLLQEKGRFSLHPFVQRGQRVRVRDGCLKGLEGILVENDKKKVVISIESIQRSLAIEIAGYELELA